MKTKILITFGLFFFMVNVNLQAQYACGSAIDITSVPYDANNLATSDANYFAAWAACDDEVEEEAIYIFRYVPTIDEKLMINVTSNANRDAIIAFENCSQPLQNCLTYEEGSGGGTNTNLIVTAGEEYFIAVVTDENASFNISITKEAVLGVAINKPEPTQALDVNGAIRIGEGTTTPYAGTLKWNDTEKLLQAYDGATWSSLNKIGIDDLTEGQYNGTDHNLFLGDIDLNSSFNSTGNVAIGDVAGRFNLGMDNTFIGYRAGYLLSGDGNVIIGEESGGEKLPLATANRNVIIGNDAGLISTVGDGNVLIGWAAGREYFGLLNNNLIIDNNNQTSGGNSSPLIFGDFEDNYLLLNKRTRIGNETFGVNGSDYAHIIVNANSGTIREPSYRFAKNSMETARITHDFFGALHFRYTAFGGAVKEVYFNGNGEIQQFAANAYKAGGGSWTANSDRRLKKNISHLDGSKSLEKLLQMRGVEFEWNDNVTKYQRPKGVQIGFIAQELQEVWPEKISEDEDGYLQTAYGDYDPIFVESIRALNDKITKQEKTIETLTQRLAELERLVKSGATASKNQSTN